MSTESNDLTVEMAKESRATKSEWHRILSNERRRDVIEVLEKSPMPIELEVLAAQVAIREVGATAVEEGAVERVMITLHHMHLPLMDDVGVISYDSSAKFVETHEEFDTPTT